MFHFCLIISFLVNFFFGWARFREVFLCFLGVRVPNLPETKKPTATKVGRPHVHLGFPEDSLVIFSP